MSLGLRVVPPSPSRLASDPAAPVTLALDGDLDRVMIATAACGLGAEAIGDTVLVRAAPARLPNLLRELQARESPLAAMLQRYLEPVTTWQLRDARFSLDRPIIMGILNLTDDSFSGDGVGASTDEALRHAEALREAGADIIDVGAETARADRPVVEPDAEAAIVAPVIAALVRESHVVSSDTYKPLVARAALESGAALVNDISGLTLGTAAAEEAAHTGAGYILNYSYSVPKHRPDSPPDYAGDVVGATIAWMRDRLAELETIGLHRDAIAIDPGIAFGKSHAEDVEVIRQIGELQVFGQPVLLAHSRKNFIGSLTGHPPADRDLETHIASVIAYEQGARIFRVHDVAGARRALDFTRLLVHEPTTRFAPDATSWPWRAGASSTHTTTAPADKPAPTGQRW